MAGCAALWIKVTLVNTNTCDSTKLKKFWPVNLKHITLPKEENVRVCHLRIVFASRIIGETF